jgi:hypothetical protein
MESLSYQASLIGSLAITLSDDLPSYTIGSLSASSIESVHVYAATGSWREHLQQFQVNLGIMGAHKGKGNQGPALEMLTNKAINSFAVLKSIKQSRESFGLIVQRKHHLVHTSEGGAARLGQDSSLGDPILEHCKLHRLRSVSPEAIRNRISMSMSCTKVRVYAPGSSFAIKACVCRNGRDVTSSEHGAEIDQERERLTFHGFPKALDFLEKKLFGIHSPQSFGKSNVDLGSHYLQLMLSVFKLVMQGSNQRELTCGRYSPLNSTGRASDRLI